MNPHDHDDSAAWAECARGSMEKRLLKRIEALERQFEILDRVVASHNVRLKAMEQNKETP